MSLPVFSRVIVETLRACVPTTFEAMVGTPPRDLCTRRIDTWARGLVEGARIQIQVEGLENVRAGECYVVMSNHQSHFDIPILYQSLPLTLRMVAKAELFKIPFFGQAMRAAEIISVNRKNRREAMEAIEAAKTRIESGLSIWIAPEGTRSRDGQLGEFKKGGFHLALGTGARILPVTIVGSGEVLPAKTLKIQRNVPVRVVIGAPIDPAEYGRKRLDDLVAEVRSVIASGLASPESSASVPPQSRKRESNGKSPVADVSALGA
jgi:1-acyl-sn-glycerol-3-phosphate acyltransferase